MILLQSSFLTALHLLGFVFCRRRPDFDLRDSDPSATLLTCLVKQQLKHARACEIIGARTKYARQQI